MNIIVNNRALKEQGELTKEMLTILFDKFPKKSYILGTKPAIITFAKCIPFKQLDTMDEVESVLLTDSKGPFLKEGYTFIFPSIKRDISPFTIPNSQISVFYDPLSLLSILETMYNIKG